MKKHCMSVSIAVTLFIVIHIVGGAMIDRLGSTPALFLEPLLVLLSAFLPLFLFKKQLLLETSDVGFSRPSKSSLRYLLLLPLFIVTISIFATVLTELAELVGYRQEIILPSDPTRLILMAVLLPALCEELLFRYVCLSPFAKESPCGAIWISAILFAFVHANFIQIPYALVAGLALGALAVLTGSVWIPILFHMANNLVSVVFHLLGDGLATGIIETALLAVAAISVPFLLRKKAEESASILYSLLSAVRPKDRKERECIAEAILSPLLVPILLCLWLAVISCLQ